MCSTTRGPASVPSLVTWPTRNSTNPRRFASRISSCAQARTWLTVPGAESRLSRYIVWIESMITTSGGCATSSVAMMSRRFIAAARSTGACSKPSRRARRRTWSTDSSPETYAHFAPFKASCAAACSSSVDLPIPGSPPTSSTEPATSPPPLTRSNSPMPVARRGTGSPTPCNDTKSITRPFANALPCGDDASGAASSAMLFHAPHASQRPAHLPVTAPQD